MTIAVTWSEPDTAQRQYEAAKQAQQGLPQYQQDRQVKIGSKTGEAVRNTAAYAQQLLDAAPQRDRQERDPVLMSADNPGGWKLEELIVQLRHEIAAKNARLAAANSPLVPLVPLANAAAQHVSDLNHRIIAGLFIVEGFQRQILAFLDTLGPDQGPLGQPRLPAAAVP